MAGNVAAGRRPRVTQVQGRLLLLASLVLLTVGAWALTVYQAQTMDMPMGIAVRGAVDAPADDNPMVGMPGMAMDDTGSGAMNGMASASMSGMSGMGWTWDALLTFVVVWSVMMAAMMFPAAAPMLFLFHATATRRRAVGSAFVPTWVFALGYLVVWTAIGVVTWLLVQAGSELASRMSEAQRETWAPLALGGVLLLAGLYQFTPFKGACLRQCQTPFGFVMTHWHEGTMGALRMGMLHGALCLGCCWVLFAVLVATGVMSLAWMLLLTLVVFAEKVLPLGRWSSNAIGAAFMLLGGLVASGVTNLPWVV